MRDPTTKPTAEQKRIATAAGDELICHIDQMYPAMWDGVPRSARTSIRNLVYNRVLAILTGPGSAPDGTRSASPPVAKPPLRAFTPPPPFMCSRSKEGDEWHIGGETLDAAIEAGLGLWGEEHAGGFWIAPSHHTTEAEVAAGHSQPFTVEIDKAEWVPLRA